MLHFTIGVAIIFPRMVDTHCDRIHSSLKADHCFDRGNEGQQPVDRKEFCAEYWYKRLQEGMDQCTFLYDIADLMLKYCFLGTTPVLAANVSANEKIPKLTAPPGWLSGERVGLMTWWL